MGIDQLHINDWDKEEQIFSFTLQAATCAFGLAAQVGCKQKRQYLMTRKEHFIALTLVCVNHSPFAALTFGLQHAIKVLSFWASVGLRQDDNRHGQRSCFIIWGSYFLILPQYWLIIIVVLVLAIDFLKN